MSGESVEILMDRIESNYRRLDWVTDSVEIDRINLAITDDEQLLAEIDAITRNQSITIGQSIIPVIGTIGDGGAVKFFGGGLR